MTHEIVQRAESKLGEKLYNLFANNCEHFATWCMTGNLQSEQIKQGTAGAVSVTGAGLGSIGATVASRVAADIAFKNLGPIAKTAVNLGLRSAPAVSGTAAMGIAAISVAPGLVAQFAVNQALADDDSLPDAERKARELGRGAAWLAGLTGVGAAFIVAVPVAAAIGAVAPVIGGYGLYYLNKPKDKGYKK